MVIYGDSSTVEREQTGAEKKRRLHRPKVWIEAGREGHRGISSTRHGEPRQASRADQPRGRGLGKEGHGAEEGWTRRDPRGECRGDPQVTGVLPIAFEGALKVLRVLQLGGKEYICIAQLHRPVAEVEVRDSLKAFSGEILQRPPLKSSVKRVVRARTIYYIDALEVQDRLILFKVGCQAGTYIRKLVFDLGEYLGVGAHMRELRRTRAGPFAEDTLVTLHSLLDAHLRFKESSDESGLRKFVLPVESAVSLLPKISIRDSAVDAICHGADLAAPGVVSLADGISKGDIIAVCTLKGELVSVGTALVTSEEMLEMEHGIVANTERVVMSIGTYPKSWSTEKRRIFEGENQ